MNIGEKMFTYIDTAKDLTLSMVQQYKNSLIILGDEKQMFLPLTGTYVGLGQSAYSYILTKLNQSHSLSDGLDSHLHQNTVNSIYTNYAPSELRPHLPTTAESINTSGQVVTQTNYEYQLKANKDIVIKGLHDYDSVNKKGATTDDLGTAITPPTAYGSTGITVNIQHNGTHVTGVDEYGFEYTYWTGQDYITIDDKLTWSYITSRNSYIMEFAKTMAVQQANRVYKNILGVDVVYIEKEFNEAFLYDQYEHSLKMINRVFVKLANGTYEEVEVHEENGHWYVVRSTDNTKVLYSDTDQMPTGYTLYTQQQLEQLLAELGGYETQNGKTVPVWYHVDAEHTANSNTSLADGITTIREISYILDKLSDGDDEGINLAYNLAYNYTEIQNLKKWQQNLGENTVSSIQSQSKNTLLTVSYYSSDLWDVEKDAAAIGNVKLDLDLVLAQTYKDKDNNTHAAYLNAAHQGDSAIYVWETNLDKTNTSNYRQITSQTVTEIINDFIASGATSSTSVDIYTWDSNEGIFKKTGASVQVSGLAAHVDDYVFWGKTKKQVNVEQGLTTVEWVTSYVAWGVQDIVKQFNEVNGDITNLLETKLKELKYEDTAVEGQYVSEVDQTDGKITVTRKKLPLDVILANDIVYTNDIYMHISGSECEALLTANTSRTDIFELTGGKYVAKTTLNGIDKTSHDKYFIKKNLSTFTAVPAETTAAEIITNGANSSYYVKETIGTGAINYNPIDIHKELSLATLFDTDGKVKTANTIYWLDLTSQVQKKYLDARYTQDADGHTDLFVSAYVTALQAATATNTGLADAYNVRQTIEAMFEWIDLKTNKVLGL